MKVHRQIFTASLLLPASFLFAGLFAACSPDTGASPEEDATEAVAQAAILPPEGAAITIAAITEAPTGFDNLTNDPSGTFCSQAEMDATRAAFEAPEVFTDGIGPTFNNISCVSCHQSPFFATGTGSQITELRAGHFNGVSFVDHPGGSLINDRATDRSIQEHILSGNEVQTLRLTLSLAGDGFVEAIDSNVINAISLAQPAAQRGTVIQVPVLEAAGNNRVGRFGWKNQNSSLLSFAADAYINEMGITNRLLATENTSNGTVVQGGPFDGKADPAGVGEDDENDIDEFTQFMRCLKAPPRGPITAAVTRGQTNFNNAGCAVCHVGSINTITAGSVINGGAFTVPASLGDKTIHPFSDYLLHNVNTGDGIVQNGGQGTRNQVRTAALWGIGARTRFMHDGASLTVSAAITRHGGQAAASVTAFNGLGAGGQSDLLAFLFSL
jgi:CxxC motif-containing protein (DUF1111 family)